jgi:Arc/MetJ family transcription regulator
MHMRTTIALDDELVKQAEYYTGITEKAALVREALTVLSGMKRPGGWRLSGEVIRRLRPRRAVGRKFDPGRHVDLDRPSAKR